MCDQPTLPGLRFVTTDLRLTSLLPLLRWLGYGGLIPFAALFSVRSPLTLPALASLRSVGQRILGSIWAILTSSPQHCRHSPATFRWSSMPPAS